MLSKLWEKIGEGIAERAIVTTYGPGLIFFAGGTLAYGERTDIGQLVKALNAQPVATQIALAIVALFAVVFSASLVEEIQSWVIRICEGYFPGFLDSLRLRLSNHWGDRIRKKYDDLQSLASADSDADKLKKYRLDAEIAHLPVNPKHAMPTLLGNLLRASEEYPNVRYGLNAVICWPRLYPLLPDAMRQLIDVSRGKLNESARLLTWSILFLVWLGWQWWAIFSLPVILIAYRGMVSAAGVYGDLIRSSFDLYRFELYRSLCWDLPQTPDGEEICGKALTAFLFRGAAPKEKKFVHRSGAI